MPFPKKILSKPALKNAWNNSRDASANAGRAGTDGVTAQNFAANLDSNLSTLSQRLAKGSYGPSQLKPVFIPKANSNKERMICIPCVADRLVQRAIVHYLVKNQKLPIYNSSSFGFIEGLGTSKAIKRAVELRNQYEWCLKTDIETFFDSIPRNYLKERVVRSLGNHSLVPIISRVINCEIKLNSTTRDKIKLQGIQPGVGLRQGMPLSPILANLVLSKFDREIEQNKIDMVRYADDLLLFFNDKDSAQKGHQLVIDILKRIDLKIPEIEDNSKTKIFAPRTPISFLGREIFHTSENGYVAGVSQKQIEKIKKQIRENYAFKQRIKLGSNLQNTVVELWQSISAYLGIYKDAHNFFTFEQEMRNAARETISTLFIGIFGKDALSKLENFQRNFLGIGHLNIPPAINDLEV